jgi:hypothetical protein
VGHHHHHQPLYSRDEVRNLLGQMYLDYTPYCPLGCRAQLCWVRTHSQ